jgi:PAS domain S-box-containing protein
MQTLRHQIDRLKGRYLRLNLRGKITALLLSVVVTGGLLIMVAAYFAAKYQITTQTHSLLNSRSMIEKREIELKLDGLISVAQSISNNPVTSNALADSGGREIYLTPLLQSQKLSVEGSSMTVIDYRGRVIVSSVAPTPAFEAPKAYEELLAVGSARAKIWRVSHTSIELEIFFPIRYRLTNSVEGGLLLRIPLNSLLAPSSELDGSLIKDMNGVAVAGVATANEALEIEAPLALSAPLDELKLKLAVSREQKYLVDNLRLLMFGFLCVGVIAIVGLFYFASAIARMIARPIGEIATAAEKIAATGRPVARLSQYSDDEFGRMSVAFNTMIDRLSESYADLEGRVAARTKDLVESHQQIEATNERLRQRELYLRATIDNLPFFFWLKDAECRFLAVNKVFAEACGKASPEEVVGLTDFDVWPDELAKQYRKDDLEVIETRLEKIMEEPVAGGTDEGWIETFKKPVVSKDGTLLGTVGFARDISERRIAEAHIRDHVEQLNSIFTLSPDGFISFDSKHCVKYVSAAFTQMTGLNGNEIIGASEMALGQRLADLCIPQARFAGISALREKQRLNRGEGQEGKQKIELLAGKRVIEVGLREAQAKSISQILYLRDITHEAEIDRMKSEFLSTAAHELRTPMASIYGFSELLLAQPFNAQEQHELLSTIFKQSELMASIINELLDLARIESRRGKDFSIATIDIGELLTEVIAGYKTPDGRSKPKFEILAIPLMVRADHNKLFQAFSNVISNAYKYSPAGGEVEVELKLSELEDVYDVSQIGISIVDHGLGMSPEQASRVFERFYRADTSGRIPGTGLGMSIVHEIVDLHGGHVSIDTALGKGTQVTIWLPSADQSYPPNGAPVLGVEHSEEST